ncbi:hypothetical protein P9112_014737 [Eukaryota sp. TZLM1-RC]
MDPVSQFLSIFPDASPETAKQFLDITNGDIEQAIVFYTDSAPPEAFPTSSQPPSRPLNPHRHHVLLKPAPHNAEWPHSQISVVVALNHVNPVPVHVG